MSYPYDAKQNEAISHYWFAEGFSSEELKLKTLCKPVV